MAKLKLTVACGDYEIVRALSDGTVQADGIELVMLTGMGSRERHWRMARKTEFDVCEINIGGYYMARDRGEALAAIPVFLHRRFRHGFVFVNAKSGIREPKDLIGKRIGGTNFQPASNIWMRGILEEYYGVPHRQCTWLVERSEDFEFTPPKDLRIEMAPPEKRLDVMLAEGEIPAMLSPDLPPLFRDGDKRIVRLFPNYKDIEIEFFRNTGIFPIMHVNVVRQEIIDKYPWVATNLVKAFDEAKALAYRHVANPRSIPLAWVRTAWEEQLDVLGADPWAYGLGEVNRKNVQTVLRYCHQQGLIGRMMPLGELFADTDLGDAGGGAENI
jgi:4,5-dihydroxyphthalate decarboxylase